VEGWEPDLASRRGLAVFVAHGRRDPVISVEFARAAVERMQAADLAVSYHESDVGHQIDPAHVPAAVAWLASTLPGDAG
jgi:phospholipase/carboxylesterase